jgi:hypothetical protein
MPIEMPDSASCCYGSPEIALPLRASTGSKLGLGDGIPIYFFLVKKSHSLKTCQIRGISVGSDLFIF